MSDEPSREALLRFLERVQLQQLEQTRRWLHHEQQRKADLAARQPPPPPPDWLLQFGIGDGRPPLAVHVGGCNLAGGRTRPITRDQALRALADDVEACQVCRPDRDLGVL
ncbi:DUF6233 domain-containing protein [Streptomyces chryseus]